MIIKNNRKRSKGLTLLEVLVSIIILAGTLMAFAMSFPSSYKIQRMTSNSSQAAKLAGAIAEEIRSLPSAGNVSLLALHDGKYIESFEKGVSGSKNLMSNRYCQTLRGVQELKEIGSKGIPNLSKYGNCFYSLDGDKNGRSGIVISHIGNNTYNADSQFWQIRVTISWPETVSGKSVRRSATVISGRTGNRW